MAWWTASALRHRIEAQGVSADSYSTAVGDHEEAVQIIIHWLRSGAPENFRRHGVVRAEIGYSSQRDAAAARLEHLR